MLFSCHPLDLKNGQRVLLKTDNATGSETYLFPRPIIFHVWCRTGVITRPCAVCGTEVVGGSEKAIARAFECLSLSPKLRNALLEALVFHLQLQKSVQPRVRISDAFQYRFKAKIMWGWTYMAVFRLGYGCAMAK